MALKYCAWLKKGFFFVCVCVCVQTRGACDVTMGLHLAVKAVVRSVGTPDRLISTLQFYYEYRAVDANTR
jgi:hypothetical protein